MRKGRKLLVVPGSTNKPKKEIIDILDRNKVPYEKVEAELVGDEPIVWVTTPQEKKAKEVLKREGIKSFTSEVTILRLSDKPGELAKIARILTATGITVKDAHLILKSKKHALYGMTTNRPRETEKIIAKLETLLKEGKE
jgi:hypothetical protein